MKTLRMMKIIERMGMALLAICYLGLIVPGLEAATIKVNCNKGESVQRALDNLTGPATIDVKGTCTENIVIKKDDVTIEGGTFVGPDPNQNTIHVQGARRILITGATVKGARNGVFSYQGGSVTLENSLIKGNALAGIVANFGSSIIVNLCTVRDNTHQGVISIDNAALVLVNSTITSNGGTGVRVWRGSTARIGQDQRGDAGPNTIEGNEGAGIHVYQASQATIVNNTIQNNDGDGVVIESASARLTGNIIKSNLKGIEILNSGAANIGINDDGSAGGNIIEENRGNGIDITNGSSAYMLNNSIKSNAMSGVSISWATGRLITGNTIEGNGGAGVNVTQGALFQGIGGWNFPVAQDIIRDNAFFGILGDNGASLNIQSATVARNTKNGILLSLRSTLRISGSTVSENTNSGIAVVQGSAVIFDPPTGTLPLSITGNVGWGLFCGDDESSYTGDTSGVQSLSPSCTGF